MGLIRPVSIVATAADFVLEYPVVNTTLIDGGAAASVTVAVALRRVGNAAASAAVPLSMRLGDVTASVSATAPQAGATVLVTFPTVQIVNPTLWWPWQMGSAAMTVLRISSPVTDSLVTSVGLRSIESGLNAAGHRFYRVNGRQLLIRGAGWANELLLQNTRERARIEVRLARDAGFNTLRLEGQLLDDEIFDEADKL